MLLVDFINVGYGDAILLRETETPFAMLVDCGDARIGRSRPDGRRITAADYLAPGGDPELDLLVLTHLHLDHAGGLTHLLPGVRVREFWTNYLPPEEMWGHTLPAVPGAPAGRPVSDDLYGDLCKSPGPSAKPEDGDPADPDAL